jgi:DNA replication factor GINS
MKLDDLRSILLSERETGRLTATDPDIFERGHEELASLMAKVYELDDPLSDEARSLIEETLAIKETLHDLFAIRSRKILALTIMHAEGNYYDREEVKRTLPAEREMFDQITAAIEQCQRILLYNAPHVSVAKVAEVDEFGEPEPFSDDECAAASPVPAQVPVSVPAQPRAHLPHTHPCVLVRALENMDSFMGVDGRIYTLSKGDIVTLPERNAAVLTERNIVLNINLCK